ncbi:MAG: hypothetical protein UIH18_03230, partial [Fibrobacteraceae bacterium]|nr:hypothetical protein [Fibrobacteraceae bacterium]
MVSLLMLAFLGACADESPVNSLEEEIADDKYDIQTEINSDKNNYYSSSSYYYDNSYYSSSSYYYDNSYYSSSSYYY